MDTDKNWQESQDQEAAFDESSPLISHLLAIFSTARKRAIAQVRNPGSFVGALSFSRHFWRGRFRRLLV